MTDNRGFISWQMNYTCNFACGYCTVRRNKHHIPDDQHVLNRFSHHEITRAFDRTGTWDIHLTGGEPFCHTGFIDLCRRLTRKHHIQLETNFSTANLKSFADTIDPGRVNKVDTSYHVAERERTRSKEVFADNVNYFQDKGFNIRVKYVLYPPLFKRVGSDLAFLKESGVNVIILKAYRGHYSNQYYPRSYTVEERQVFRKHNKDDSDLEIRLGACTNNFGKRCSAGETNFAMNVRGDLRRCGTSQRVYGNLFSGQFAFDKQAQPCVYTRCLIPRQGLRGLVSGRCGWPSVLNQVLLEAMMPFKKRPRVSKMFQYMNKKLLAHRI